MEPLSKKFKKAIKIESHDYDRLGHVNNVVYLQWVQEIAEEHWKAVVSEESLNKYLWVALRHEIDYKKEIIPGENIMAHTFVESMEGVKSERKTLFFNSKTNELKASAKTYWCLLNAKTKRPQRIDVFLKTLFIG